MCWRRSDIDRQTHTHRHTHTHIPHTHTPYQQSLIITQQQSLTQCHNCVMVLSVDWLQEKEYEILAVQLGKEQTDRVKNTKTVIKCGHNNKLQTVTDTQQDTPCIICWQSLTDDYFWWLSSKQRTHKNCNEIVGPADSCVLICVNVQCEPVVILNGNISLLCLGLTDEIGKIQNKTFHVFVSS